MRHAAIMDFKEMTIPTFDMDGRQENAVRSYIRSFKKQGYSLWDSVDSARSCMLSYGSMTLWNDETIQYMIDYWDNE